MAPYLISVLFGPYIMAPYTEAQIRSSVYGAIYGAILSGVNVAPYTAPYNTELKKISVYGAVYGGEYMEFMLLRIRRRILNIGAH